MRPNTLAVGSSKFFMGDDLLRSVRAVLLLEFFFCEPIDILITIFNEFGQQKDQ